MLFASALAKPGLIYFCLQEAQGREGRFKGYKLMTSVSAPVYNKKKYTVSEPNPILLLHQSTLSLSVYVYVSFITEHYYMVVSDGVIRMAVSSWEISLESFLTGYIGGAVFDCFLQEVLEELELEFDKKERELMQRLAGENGTVI